VTAEERECRTCGEKHGEVTETLKDHGKQLVVLFEDVRQVRNRLPATVTWILGALLLALGTFFGLWVQGGSEMQKLMAAQYETKGAVDDLRKLVATLFLEGHGVHGATGATGAEGRPGNAGPTGPAGPAGK
jgi:hypothetical protein